VNNFGSTVTHANGLSFTDLAAMDAPTSYTCALWFKMNVGIGVFTNILFSKDTVTGLTGYSFYLSGGVGSGDARPGVTHRDGATAESADRNWFRPVTGQFYCLGWTWEGTSTGLLRCYIDGYLISVQKFTRAIAANAQRCMVGNNDSLDRGAAVLVGQVMFWSGVVLSDDEMLALFLNERPRASQQTFWVKGTAVPDTEQISSTAGTTHGTVTTAAAAVPDNYYATVAMSPALLLSATMRTELRRPDPRYDVLAELVLGGTTYRFAFAPVSSTTRGFYDRLTSLSGLRQNFNLSSYGLETSEVSLKVIDDSSKTLTKLLEGQFANNHRGSVLRVIVASDFVTEPNWATVWTGVLDRFSVAGEERSLFFVARPNEIALSGDANIQPLSASEFVNLLKTGAAAEPLTVPYGILDSLEFGGSGAVACHLVDAILGLYVVSFTKIHTVTRLWNGASVIPRTKWARADAEIGGKSFTIVDVDSTIGSTTTIRADVVGVTQYGDGSGTPIVNPAEQLRHFVNNFGIGSYTSGDWLPDAAEIDATSFDISARYFAHHSIAGRRAIVNQTGLGVLNEWATSFQTPLFWNNLGRLAILPFDPRIEGGVLYSAEHLAHEDMLNDLELGADISTLCEQVQFTYGQSKVVRPTDKELGNKRAISIAGSWL